MHSLTRKLASGAAAGLLAAGGLLAEPLVRPRQSADAAAWQLYFGSEYNTCQGCCRLSFCCGVNFPCEVVIE